MAKLTTDDIQKINEVYYTTKVYAETARRTGFSPATVKKYVIPGWAPIKHEDLPKFDMNSLPKDFYSQFKGIKDYGELCILSESEREEMEELWKEMAV